MTTYTIQRHNPSGSVHALRYNDDNEITGVQGGLYYAEVDEITANPSLLAHMDYEPDDADWANAQTWGAPTVEYPTK